MLFAAFAVAPHASAAVENSELVGGYLKIPGPAGCEGSSNLVFACHAPYGERAVRVVGTSPDGLTVYVHVSEAIRGDDPDLLVPARRDPAGVLTFPAGGCLHGRDGCALLAPDLELVDVDFAPNGDTIYALTNRSLFAIQVDDRGGLSEPALRFRLSDSEQAAFTTLALTPDGRHLYAGVTDENDSEAGGLLGFEQDGGSGTSRIVGPAGCARTERMVLVEFAGCQVARLAGPPADAVVSPDGAFLYTGSFNLPSSVAMFELDTAGGGLTQPAGTSGCVSGTGADGCAAMRLPEFPDELAAAGDTLYVGGIGFKGDTGYASVSVLRQTGGQLTQADTPAGCIWGLRAGSCLRASAIGFELGSLVVWGDRLAVSTEALALLRREPDGRLHQERGRPSCANTSGLGCMPLLASLESIVAVPNAPKLLYGNTSGAIFRMVPVAAAPPSRDPRRLVFAAPGGGALWSARRNGEALAPLPSKPCPGGSIRHVTASRTGLIAYLREFCGRGQGKIFAGRPGHERLVVTAGRHVSVDQPAIGLDGRLVAYRRVTYPDGERTRSVVEVVNLRTGRSHVIARKAREPATGPGQQIVIVRDSADPVSEGRRLPASGPQGLDIIGSDGDRRPLTRERPCRSPRKRIPGCEIDDGRPTWRPDGTVLFLRSRQYYDTRCSAKGFEGCFATVTARWLMAVRPGSRPRRLARVSARVVDLAVSSDGRLAFERAGSIWVGHPGVNRRARPVADGSDPAWIRRRR